MSIPNSQTMTRQELRPIVENAQRTVRSFEKQADMANAFCRGDFYKSERPYGSFDNLTDAQADRDRIEGLLRSAKEWSDYVEGCYRDLVDEDVRKGLDDFAVWTHEVYPKRTLGYMVADGTRAIYDTMDEAEEAAATWLRENPFSTSVGIARVEADMEVVR